MINTMAPHCRTFTAVPILLIVVVSAACTRRPALPALPSTQPPSASASPSAPPTAPTTSAAPRRLSIPPVTPGELSRVVYSAKTETVKSHIRRQARAGKPYMLEAACTSDNASRVIKFELSSSRRNTNIVLTGGNLTCDGEVMSYAMPLPATSVQINLGPDLTGVSSAYAVIAPSH